MMPDEQSQSSPPGWLTTHLRALVILPLTGAVIYLAVAGVAEAKTAVIGGFTLLIGALWGERAALKIPGRDT